MTTQHNTNQLMMSKKYFFAQADSWSRSDRLGVAHELIAATWSRTQDLRIPGAIHQEIAHVRDRIRRRDRATNWDLYKLWIYVMRDPGDLRNWRMGSTQCWHMQPQGANSWRPALHPRRRRPTIRDVNGDAVPRAWLDRHAPDIRTQADWDQTSCYRRPRSGM